MWRFKFVCSACGDRFVFKYVLTEPKDIEAFHNGAHPTGNSHNSIWKA
ncbi:MAG: hypothetical protein KIS73_07955 [Enhydrobacter sp.]|nr:hypothetical protein [Enhydrobacter sp.]